MWGLQIVPEARQFKSGADQGKVPDPKLGKGRLCGGNHHIYSLGFGHTEMVKTVFLKYRSRAGKAQSLKKQILIQHGLSCGCMKGKMRGHNAKQLKAH